MVTVPALLGDVISRLAIGRTELDLVGRLSGRQALAKRLHRLRPDLVIIGLRENETDALIRSLLLELPSSRLIAILPDGRSMVGYELGVRQIELSDLSPLELINFIDRGVSGVNA
jgi:hypothetical protein